MDGKFAYCTYDGVDLFIDLYPTFWIVSWRRSVQRLVHHETSQYSVLCAVTPGPIHIPC